MDLRRVAIVLAATLLVAMVVSNIVTAESSSGLFGPAEDTIIALQGDVADLQDRMSAVEEELWGSSSTSTSASTTTSTASTTTSSVPSSSTSSTATSSSTTTTVTPTTTPTSSTTTTASGQTPSGWIWLESNRTYEHLAIDAGDMTYGIYGAGVHDVTIRDVSVTGWDCRYGMKLGSGPTSSNIHVDGFQTRETPDGLYLDGVEDSLFENMDIDALKLASNQYHAMYIESDNSNLTFRDSVFRGGSGYTIHLYLEGNPSHDIVFERCIIDARTGRYPVVIGSGFSNVTFRDCVFYGKSGQVFLFYGGRDVLVEGFEAHGDGVLVSGWPEGAVTFRNGTFDGPSLGSATGVVFENVTLD